MAVSLAAGAPAVANPWLRRRSYLQDALLVCVSGLFFYVHLGHAIREASATNLFFAIEQGVLVGVFLSRRRTTTTSQRPWDWFVATIGGWGALALQPDEATGLQAVAGASVQVVGLFLVTVCLLNLGKSFGVVAANRGLKVRGPYRVVRHPVYASHLVTQLGFVLANPGLANAAVVLTVTLFQVLRIRAEERVLTETADYVSYARTVRWRLLPGVY